MSKDNNYEKRTIPYHYWLTCVSYNKLLSQMYHYSPRKYSASDEFYSLFYLGLWCEAKGENTKAESYMRSAVKSSYSQGFGSNDYMTSVAKVHCKTRGWSY